MEMKNIPRFQRERDAALMTMDIYEVRKFALKWFKRLPPPVSLRTETAAMHMAIVAAETLPRARRLHSRQWLTDNGFD